jgi:hypothetical protein
MPGGQQAWAALQYKYFTYVNTGSYKYNSWKDAIRIDTIGWIIFIHFATCLAASG